MAAETPAPRTYLTLRDREQVSYACGQLAGIAEFLPLLSEIDRDRLAHALEEIADSIGALLTRDLERRDLAERGPDRAGRGER